MTIYKHCDSQLVSVSQMRSQVASSPSNYTLASKRPVKIGISLRCCISYLATVMSDPHRNQWLLTWIVDCYKNPKSTGGSRTGWRLGGL